MATSDAPKLPEKRYLLVWIHGFMGSDESFDSFPLDVLRSLRDSYGLVGIEARVFPQFETHGDPEKAVVKLINWLLLHATTAEYDGVLLLAHSMGGLMACDAYRQLYRVNTKAKVQSRSEWLFDTAKNAGQFVLERGMAVADVVRMPVRLIEHINVPKFVDDINREMDSDDRWAEEGEIRFPIKVEHGDLVVLHDSNTTEPAISLESTISEALSSGEWMFVLSPDGDEFRMVPCIRAQNDGDISPTLVSEQIHELKQALGDYVYIVKLGQNGILRLCKAAERPRLNEEELTQWWANLWKHDGNGNKSNTISERAESKKPNPASYGRAPPPLPRREEDTKTLSIETTMASSGNTETPPESSLTPITGFTDDMGSVRSESSRIVDVNSIQGDKETMFSAPPTPIPRDSMAGSSRPTSMADSSRRTSYADSARRADSISDLNPRDLVNIVGIVCFDSPFFGLHRAIYHKAAGERIVSFATEVIPSAVREIPGAIPRAIGEMIPQKIAGFSMPWKYTEVNTPDAVEVAKDGFSMGKVVTLPADGSDAIMIRDDPTWRNSTSSLGSRPMSSGSLDEPSGLPPPPLPKRASLADVAEEITGIDIIVSPTLSSSSASSSAVPSSSSQVLMAKDTDGAVRPMQRLRTAGNNVKNALVASGKSMWSETRETVVHTDWRPITTTVLGVGAIAGASVIAPALVGASIGTAIVQKVAVIVALKYGDAARAHLQFLYPLFGGSSDLASRIDDVILEVENGHLKGFRVFFVELPESEGPPKTVGNPAPSKIDAIVQKHMHKTDKHPAVAPAAQRRTFVATPPQKYAHLFRSVETESKDEIHGHMNMFSRELNPGHYWNLVNSSAEEIAQVLRKSAPVAAS
ncbi:hypothetical protein SmJEL517_g04923 [Synchytrium microbalum]|uniref:DUF676 domain-containing protein n=1 Tax=Synchytrium microbalum TaxID=1806994 RepID=A0A507C2V6_9FUNG|nr:uncharacterized protein SmJEL517_g04923 [Synchytrium microbalum]TPX31843.1 hypothetical protein SmJEL517_g04923 [Synchytrium microbalum]